MEFIEAKQPRFVRDRGGGEQDRVLTGALRIFQLLTKIMHALVHLHHEFMKMRAVLAADRARLEEKVHEHGLAAPDIAVEINSLERCPALPATEQPSEGRGFTREAVRSEFVVERC